MFSSASQSDKGSVDLEEKEKEEKDKEDIIISMEQGDESICTVSSTTGSTSDDLCRLSKKQHAQPSAVNYPASPFAIGTCFRVPEHGSVWKIVAVDSTHVSVKLMSAGNDLTLEENATKKFSRNDSAQLTIPTDYSS